MQSKIRLGTRGSPLALVQANEVKSRLEKAHAELAEEGAVEIVVIKTTGDRVQDRPLAEIGGKGLFTKEIETALLENKIDAAVHSMKDVPTWLPDGLEISTILEREDPRDALFSNKATSIGDLPKGAVVGSSSLRRQAQLRMRRPDLKVVSIRGNVETRLRKLNDGEVDATLLAVAGLNRLGQGALVTAPLSTDEMLPAVAQGAIGLEIRRDDEATRSLLAPLNHAESALRVSVERACLDVLGGTCHTPVGVFAEMIAADQLRLRTVLALPDGTGVHRGERIGPSDESVAMGRDLGAELRGAAGPEYFAALAEG